MASTNLEVVISARDQFTGTANRVIGSLNRMNTAAGRVGRGVGQVAGGLSRLAFVAGGVAAAGLIASARAAISFEDAFAGVRKTADLTEAEFTDLAQSFRTMATTIPISANELARLGEIAGALGIEGVANIREFSRVTGLLGVTTDLTADAAATSLGHIATVLRLSGKDYADFADALVNLGNKGASTESQIAGIAERAAGGAATIGLATNELLAWSAAIANIGVEVEAGGTNFQKILIEAVKFAAEGGAELKTLAAVSGVTAAAWKKNFGTDPSSALSQFVVGLGKLSQEQQILALGELGWDNQRTARILLGLAANTDNLTTAFVNAGVASKGALSIEATKRFDTLASKITVLKNNFTEAAITIGEGFTPALGRAVEKFTAFLALDTTKTSLKQFGADIGAALDGIDWKGVLEGAKTFVGLLKDAFTILNALPDQIKLGGAAILTAFNAPIIGPAFSQIGKGVGNIALGLATGAGSLVGGKVGMAAGLLAQPVRVVNWPPGFGVGGGAGGVGGALGGGGKLALLGPLGIAAAVVVAGVIASGVTDPRHQQIDPKTGRTRTFRGTNVATEQIANLERSSGPLRERAAGGDKDAVRKLAAIEAEIRRLRGDLTPSGTRGTPGFTSGRGDIDRERSAAQLATHTVLDALLGRKGKAFLMAGAKAGTLDENAGALMSLFQTSTNPSLRSMEANLIVLKGLAAAGDTKTRAALSGDIKALQALIDAKLSAISALPWNQQPYIDWRTREQGGAPSVVVNPPENYITLYVTVKDMITKITSQQRVGPATGSRGGARSFGRL